MKRAPWAPPLHPALVLHFPRAVHERQHARHRPDDDAEDLGGVLADHEALVLGASVEVEVEPPDEDHLREQQLFFASR